MTVGLTGIAALEAEMRDRLADKNAEIARLRDAMAELLSGHDNLYRAHFGDGMDPRDDIAAKAARSLLSNNKEGAA
jgi:hypothetical protein